MSLASKKKVIHRRVARYTIYFETTQTAAESNLSVCTATARCWLYTVLMSGVISVPNDTIA